MALLRLSSLIFLAGLFMGLIMLPAYAEEQAQSFRYPEKKASGNSQLRYIQGIPVLEVEGSPEEIGEAVGLLAAKSAPKATSYPKDVLSHFSAGLLYQVFSTAGSRMAAAFPKDYSKELDSIAKASGLNKSDLIVGNTMFDLKKIVACSGVAIEPARSASGQMLFGRNLDYPSLGYMNHYTLVTVYRPKDKKAFAAVGFPGLVGTLTGMNEDGLCLAIHEVIDIKPGKKKFNYDGIPYAMCYRQVLEECSTVDEAYALLGKLPRTSTTNLLIADRKRSAVFEVSPEHVIERKSKDGLVVCCNHFCSSELKPILPINVRRSFQRFSYLENLRTSEEKPGLAEIAEHLDTVNLGKDTLQTILFEPGPLKLHLAYENTPSSQGPFHSISLAKMLGK